MGILAHRNNARAHGHQHAEAFCWMTYGTKPGVKFIRLRIWNSRDGVTPFITVCKEYGLELQHINYDEDRYDPTYKPVKGDLIWRSWTEEEARAIGQIHYKSTLDEYEDLLNNPFRSEDEEMRFQYVKKVIEAGEQAQIEGSIYTLFTMGQPRLMLVEEDWK